MVGQIFQRYSICLLGHFDNKANFDFYKYILSLSIFTLSVLISKITAIVSASNTAPGTAQGKTRTITCTGGSYITITKATYGRGTTCGDPNALTIVDALCTDQKTCSVTADDSTFPSSTCNANQRESLQITYTCTQREYLHGRLCSLNCLTGSIMDSFKFWGKGSSTRLILKKIRSKCLFRHILQ